ncbi:RHO-related protein from plants 10 isoform 1 [Hibiscus syriacus]|uniref:RHO-related protein from plants 10 isoform 1 n=1 Tax=Hibiscus syriacus TaxID=106335 RepID=A0A6A3B191_HIBSY|nr:RHO-related protein from plants 10 isoform 1 [Hibiscus syriacus]
MHGRGGGEERNKSRHMWKVPTRATAVISPDRGAYPTVNFFSKDGRKISVGDCALFKPPQDSLPFVGIIRCLIAGKEDKLKLGVNWLYRPSDLKLGRGTLLEAAPNEIFYSFHKDEIPAASLLNPCKVAFLHKDVDLPSGICSFVCRRVYDITKKCLWWLTDQDYITIHQEEVDRLLYKTSLEMQEAVQPGGRSPKPMTSQLKPGSESAQNSASSFLSQTKGKKRERVDQGSEPVKQEHCGKMDDRDSGHGKPEFDLKSEIAKITEKGGLEDSEGVEKLVQPMMPERNVKKIDMEVHKGRTGDSSCTKDDRSVDDFLLTVLWALDKLPVNLTALQMCNIGSSSQVVPCSARPRLSEVSHSGSKHCASPEVALKSSVTHLSASRSGSVKLAQGDFATKSASPFLGPMKAVSLPASASTNPKDGQAQNAIVDTPDPQTTTRDEKRSSSSQSHNNSQSCSTDHAKTGGVSKKEDARNSTAGSGTVTKISGSSSRHRQPINGTISHKFVVKVSNRGRSPAQSTTEGSPDCHSAMNRASPALSEKHEQLDRNIKDKSDTYQENVIIESWQSSGLKHVVAGRESRDGGDGSAAAGLDEENCQTGEDARKSNDVTKTAFPSSGNELKSEILQEASFISMNALIESCVKYSEADACMPVEDDAGMNLLARVAAEESSKSDVALPIDSPQRNTPVVENSPSGNDTVLKYCAGDDVIRDPDQFVDGADDEHLMQGVIVNSCPEHAENTAYQFLENCKLKETTTAALVNLPLASIMEKKAGAVDDDAGSSSLLSMEMDVEHKKNVPGSSDRSSVFHQKAPADIGHSTKGTDKEALPLSSKGTILENVDEKVEKDVETDTRCHASHSEKHTPGGENVTTQKGEHLQEILEGNEGCEPEATSPCKASATVMETEPPLMRRGSKLTDAEADEAEEHASANTDARATGGADTDAKLEFDLNEGFNVHEGKFGGMKNLTIPGCSTPVQLISPLPFPVSSVSGGLPTSVAAAAAAKGLFVPPDDKGALGWQESAATSAFQPDEPRKTLDIPLGSSKTSSPDATSGKESRPPLDIDLNLPDERVLEDLASRSSAPIRSSGGLDLDLNKVDEPAHMPNQTIGNNHRLEVFMQPVSSSSTSGVLNIEAKLHRDFDLNNGPDLDEVSAEPSPFSKHGRSNNVPSQPPVPSLRINNTEIANFSSWFPMGNTYSGFTVPTILTNREQPFPIVATAVPFPATLFPFGTTFPLPSTSFSSGSTTYVDSSPSGRLCFPTVHSQLLGTASAVPSHYPRPYIVNLPDGSNSSGAESGRKWGGQGLDLNSGPGGSNIEGRGETAPLVPRQLTVASSGPCRGASQNVSGTRRHFEKKGT